MGHFSLSLNAGSINCDCFNMSVLLPDFWDHVPCRRKRIANPWLKSLSKARHCLLKRKEQKNVENVLLKSWTYLQVCLSLFWIGEATTVPFTALFIHVSLFWVFLQSTCFILFSFSFYFSFSPAEELLNSRLCFLIFFQNDAFCKSTLHGAVGRAGAYWTLWLP